LFQYQDQYPPGVGLVIGRFVIGALSSSSLSPVLRPRVRLDGLRVLKGSTFTVRLPIRAVPIARMGSTFARMKSASRQIDYNGKCR